jgi:hypothetical protein
MNQHAGGTPTGGGQRSKLEPSAFRRARTSNNPCAGRSNGNTKRGRRIRDLMRSYLRQMGNQAEASRQADALAAAELKVAAEDVRVRYLNGGGSLADLEHIVRLEHLADRAVRRPVKKRRHPSHLLHNSQEAGATIANAARHRE